MSATKKNTIEPAATDELDEAMTASVSGQPEFTHRFRTPFIFEGETFDELSFNFAALTGRDSLAIETELAALGKTTIVPEFSGDYLIRMAVRACTTKRSDGRKLGIDAFSTLPLTDFLKIRGQARSFLLRAGS